MPYDLTLLTCTADQPIGMALCEHFMQRQTLWPHLRIQWIVVDDGETPVHLTLGQQYIRRHREKDCTGAESLCRNMVVGLRHVEAKTVAVIEHDDFYGEHHLEHLCTAKHKEYGVWGEGQRYYYNVAHRCYRLVDDGIPALCQMAFSSTQIPALVQVAQDMMRAKWWGLDRGFWLSQKNQTLIPSGAVVGIKGLPGRPGIGYGHRPTRGWARDEDWTFLRSLAGAYAGVYADIMKEQM